MIVDESFNPEQGRGCYRLTQVHHLDGRTLRVRVHRDSYQGQSHATVEVLTPHLTWTELAERPPADWWPSTEPTPSRAALAPVAAHLVERARAILSDPTGPLPPGSC